jgi:carbonic anhydrase/acetyltransferase-like protein (isoleucine patch superfamily)
MKYQKVIRKLVCTQKVARQLIPIGKPKKRRKKDAHEEKTTERKQNKNWYSSLKVVAKSKKKAARNQCLQGSSLLLSLNVA